MNQTIKSCLVLIGLLICVMGVRSQQPKVEPATKDTKQSSSAPTTPPKQLDPNFIRWRVYLNTLEQDARSVPDERRPYVVADVAAAYWEFDKDEATRLFTSALDEALKLAQT